MPYTNVPESDWGKMDSCVSKIEGKYGKDSAVAICYSSVVEGKSMKEAIDQHTTLAQRVLGAIISRLVKHKEILSSVGAREFLVTKEADGKLRWVIISSSSFEDRDKEIVSQKALEDDVQYADRVKEYGPLLWWHLPQAVLGDCDFNAMHGRLLIESGTFRSSPVGERIKEVNDKLGASMGFRHPDNEPVDGVFYHIRRYERSLLPRGKASNYLTAMPVVTKETQNMEELKLKELKDLLGGDEALVNQVLTVVDGTQKAAEGAGLRTKAKSDETDTPPEDQMMMDEAEKKAAAKKKLEAEKKAEKKEVDTIGAMTPDQLGDLIGRIVGEQISARTEKEAQLDNQLGELKTAMATVAKAVNDVQSKVKDLTEEAPKGLKGGFRASTDDSTKVKEGSALKNQRPAADDFLGQIGAVVDAMENRNAA